MYVHICIRVSYVFKDVLWVIAVHTIIISWKQSYEISREQIKKSCGNQQKTMFGDSLGKPHWQNQKKLEKTKKTKLLRECLVWGSCLFFLFCLGFLGYFLVLTLKKLKNSQFFVFWVKWWLRIAQKQKNQGFLVFHCAAKKKLKPQTPIFHNFLTISLSKKPKNIEIF